MGQYLRSSVEGVGVFETYAPNKIHNEAKIGLQFYMYSDAREKMTKLTDDRSERAEKTNKEPYFSSARSKASLKFYRLFHYRVISKSYPFVKIII